MDLATLTGACVVALGHEVGGMCTLSTLCLFAGLKVRFILHYWIFSSGNLKKNQKILC